LNDQSQQANRLAHATSPYLLQHAHNPVDWYPWGEEALDLARRENRPILLSIGYSACHWCHVMAHESFEDEETAAVMNELFVNIKVDREERPDLDKIYQSVHQVLARRPGGWPLTVFLTPDDHAPIFVGTYFPKTPRHGLPSFADLLRGVAKAYSERRDQIDAQLGALTEVLTTLNPKPANAAPSLSDGPLWAAGHQLEQSFDRRYGGFGQAPKFPHPTDLDLLLRLWHQSAIEGRADSDALQMATRTLEAMALGGINDQVAGGFCRYSVDERWMIPHFEKMLYDNAQLLAVYADAWSISRNPLFRRTAESTADWAIREMQSPEGGFYSSLDADSEGVEGRYYVWDRAQVRTLLAPDEYDVLAAVFGLDRPPNFEESWHLHTWTPPEDLAAERCVATGMVRDLLDHALPKLRKARSQRVAPHRDEKILTSWNGLMIKGLARAARRLDREDYGRAAERAMDFLVARMRIGDRFLASYKDGRAAFPAYLDDHAFLLDAALELLQLRWRREDLDLAMALADTLIDHFVDRDAGGFHFTANDHERLLFRPKPLADEATPSGNGIACRALLQLGHLLGDARYIEAAEQTLHLAWESVEHTPFAHASLLQALADWLGPSDSLVIRHSNEPELSRWQQRTWRNYVPGRYSLAVSGNDALPGLLSERRAVSEGIAYMCTGLVCRAPIRDFGSFEQALSEREIPTPEA